MESPSPVLRLLTNRPLTQRWIPHSGVWSVFVSLWNCQCSKTWVSSWLPTLTPLGAYFKKMAKTIFFKFLWKFFTKCDRLKTCESLWVSITLYRGKSHFLNSRYCQYLLFFCPLRVSLCFHHPMLSGLSSLEDVFTITHFWLLVNTFLIYF